MTPGPQGPCRKSCVRRGRGERHGGQVHKPVGNPMPAARPQRAPRGGGPAARGALPAPEQPGKARPGGRERRRGPGLARGPPPGAPPRALGRIGAAGGGFAQPERDGSPAPRARAPGTATPSGRSGTHRLSAHGSPRLTGGSCPGRRRAAALRTTTPGKLHVTRPGISAPKALTREGLGFSLASARPEASLEAIPLPVLSAFKFQGIGWVAPRFSILARASLPSSLE